MEKSSHIRCFICFLIVSNLLSLKFKALEIKPGAVRNFFPKNPKVHLLANYTNPSENTIVLKTHYGAFEILNKDSWANGLMDKRPTSVDLVMTLHPSNLKEWRKDFFSLIGKRMIELYGIDSVFLLDKTIEWNIYLQTKGKTINTAKNKIHGFIINYYPLKEHTDKAYYKDVLLKFSNRDFAKMIQKEKLISVVNRNLDKWKRMLVITDCTTSMKVYGSEVALWHMLNNKNSNVVQFAFFNDGDGMWQSNKEDGHTGGIHLVKPKNKQELINTIRLVTQMGYGNVDNPENDAESIIKAIEGTKGFSDVVLIAANKRSCIIKSFVPVSDVCSDTSGSAI